MLPRWRHAGAWAYRLRKDDPLEVLIDLPPGLGCWALSQIDITTPGPGISEDFVSFLLARGPARADDRIVQRGDSPLRDQAARTPTVLASQSATPALAPGHARKDVGAWCHAGGRGGGGPGAPPGTVPPRAGADAHVLRGQRTRNALSISRSGSRSRSPFSMDESSAANHSGGASPRRDLWLACSTAPQSTDRRSRAERSRCCMSRFLFLAFLEELAGSTPTARLALAFDECMTGVAAPAPGTRAVFSGPQHLRRARPLALPGRIRS